MATPTSKLRPGIDSASKRRSADNVSKTTPRRLYKLSTKRPVHKCPKRKFFAVADNCDEDETSTNSESCSPRKRLRVQARASIDEAQTQPDFAASDVAPGQEEESPLEEVNEEASVEDLGARMRQVVETNERIKKEAEQIAAKLKKIEDEDLECMVCRDIVQNPQMLPCGHSACYSCLRNWWTQPPEEYDGAEIIDTEAEDNINDVAIVGEAPNAEGGDLDPEQEPHPRRRHIFSSAVNRKKMCPYCTKEVKYRPVPNLQLRAVVETLIKNLAQPPLPIQAQTRRSDLWHGIFHLENEGNHFFQEDRHMRMFMPRLGLEPGPPPPPHPDPILNDIAQGQHRRAVEEAVARRERERARAFEDGRIIGIIEGRRQRERERAERPQQAANNGELLAQGLLPGNPPPIPQQVPVDVPGVLQIPQDPVPQLLGAEIVPPPRDDAAAM